MTLEPSAGRIEGREHLLPVRVYFEDTDFTGIVYHGAFVRFLERGRSDYLRLADVRHAALLDQGQALTLVRLEADFKRPARIDDALLVRTRFEAVKGARLTIGQQVLRGDDLLVEARVEAVLIGLDGRPRRPTPVMVAAIRPLLF
ncbi:YbgC/FadM family acyl-CoA thioesterase [Phenylobacterium sp.]|uniref:YbgC/FadM family acyl-CoA thioesterase n=1 Tax=Phenylobacterium sp. TaxID=1871053 RepID=UPI002F40D8A4